MTTTATVNPYAAGTLPMPDARSYHVAAVLDDGETLCERCIRDATNPVHPDDGSRDGWGIVGFTHSGEVDTVDHCAHCNAEWTGHDPTPGRTPT